MKKRVIIILVIMGFLLMVQESMGYDDVETHPKITNIAVDKSILKTYLPQELGPEFLKGYESIINGKSVMEWIRDGSKLEDSPNCRASNHFHNPLRSWDQSYMTDQPLWLDYECSAWKPWYSNVTWATGYLSPSPTGPKTSFDTHPDLTPINWDKARDYYYNAFTATLKGSRETYFTLTFKAVGQVMHLLEDVSVPAHVRNDFTSHLTFNGVNSLNPIKWFGNPFEYFVKINPNLIASVQPTVISFPDLRLTDFWDTDQYAGSNPSASVSIGSSEYTNANFLSDTSIFKEPSEQLHSFPYPAWSSVEEYDEIDLYTGHATTYIRKVRDGESINHLAAAKWYYKYLPTSIKNWGLELDDKCHYDYASLLIPRAVGYSAGLLKYFFRGMLEITAPDVNVYSVADGSVIPQQFTRLRAKVRNITPNEEVHNCDMQQQNCIVQAVARYKNRTDYQPDLSTDPPTEGSREAEYSYSVSAPIPIASLSSTTPSEFMFDFTSNPIPAGITDLYLNVIFKGTLGNEADIAIAVGMKDLNEPQHFSIWNTTDRFYLDGVLRTADEIRTTPVLLARVDFDGDGVVNEIGIGEPYIDPYEVTTYVAFYPTTETPAFYNASYTPLPGGRYGRIIMLSDMPTFYLRVHRESTNPPEVLDTDLLYSGVTNQENDGIFENTQVNTFRTIIQHQWSAYSRYFPDASGISTAPWPAPAHVNAYQADALSP